MDLKYVKSLLKLFDESTATEITIEEDGGKIKLSKKVERIATQQSYMMPQQVAPAPFQQAAPVQNDQSVVTSSNSDDNSGLHEVTSPIVGTFYRTPSPDSEPFVKVGDRVEIGQTLCIVEAMKVMNEIESDVSGEIVKIVVDNAQPVEFNQVLFLIKAD